MITQKPFDAVVRRSLTGDQGRSSGLIHNWLHLVARGSRRQLPRDPVLRHYQRPGASPVRRDERGARNPSHLSVRHSRHRDPQLPPHRALRYLDHRGRLVAALRDVLRDAEKAGVQIGRLYLDREFYTYEVLAWLSGQGRTVIVPLRLGSRQRKRWEHGQKSYVTEHVLKDSKGRGPPLPLRIHVVVRYQAGKKFGKHGCQYLIYAVLGHVALAARHAVPLRKTHELYRRRFGIESSYRIAHLALPRTCARSVAWRLLYLGVALMLENEWCALRLLYTSQGRQGPTGMDLREELLRFEDLLELLFLGVGRVLGTIHEIGNPKPPPRRLTRWGMHL